jgi:hypothetical protein
MPIDINTLRDNLNDLIFKVNNLEAYKEQNNNYANILDFYEKILSINDELNGLDIDTININNSFIANNILEISDNKLQYSKDQLTFTDSLRYNDKIAKTQYDLAMPEFKDYPPDSLEKGEYYLVVNKDQYKIPFIIKYYGNNIKNDFYKIENSKLTSDYNFVLKKRG